MSIDDERRNGIKNAMEAFIKKQAEASRPKRKNEKPEKEVEKAVMVWLRAHNFDVQVIESKAKLIGGEWRKSGADFGTSDIVGTTPDGFGCFIELKAPGKRSTFWKDTNIRQVEYLLNKIDRNAFAVVVDNVEHLASWYALWLRARDQSPAIAKSYLFDLLPRKPKRSETVTPLFDE